MKLYYRVYILFTIFALFMAGDVSWGMTGRELLDACSVTEKALNNLVSGMKGDKVTLEEASLSASCTGFIEGVAETSIMYNEKVLGKIPTKESFSICFPRNKFQFVSYFIPTWKIILKYLKDHPESLHLRAVPLVINALHEAFPCK